MLLVIYESMNDKKILTVTLNPAVDYSVGVPGFLVNSVNRAESGRRDPGGKGINTATVTSRFGIKTAVTGFLGKENCSVFNEHFERNAIVDRFIYIDGFTREGIKINDNLRKETTDINFPGFSVDEKSLQTFIEEFDNLAAGYDYLLMSGSLPTGVPAHIYGRLAETASKAGAFTVVDASGKSLRSAVDSSYVNLIKPNIHELFEAFAEPGMLEILNDEESILAEADRIARSLLDRVDMIALSLGEAGSMLYTADAVYRASAPRVDVATTVGAGDSFLGGLVAGFIFGKDEAGALQMAASSAASTLTMFGPGLSEEFPPGYFYDSVTVEKVDKL